jgi:hypothetical protein
LASLSMAALGQPDSSAPAAPAPGHIPGTLVANRYNVF